MTSPRNDQERGPEQRGSADPAVPVSFHLHAPKASPVNLHRLGADPMESMNGMARLIDTSGVVMPDMSRPVPLGKGGFSVVREGRMRMFSSAAAGGSDSSTFSAVPPSMCDGKSHTVAMLIPRVARHDRRGNFSPEEVEAAEKAETNRYLNAMEVLAKIRSSSQGFSGWSNGSVRDESSGADFGGVHRAIDRSGNRPGGRTITTDFMQVYGVAWVPRIFGEDAPDRGEMQRALHRGVSQNGVAPAVIVECVRGQSLRSALDEGWRPSVTQALDLAASVADRLSDLSKVGVVNIDLSHNNVMIEWKRMSFSGVPDPTVGSGRRIKWELSGGVEGWSGPLRNLPANARSYIDSIAKSNGVDLLRAANVKLSKRVDGTIEAEVETPTPERVVLIDHGGLRSIESLRRHGCSSAIGTLGSTDFLGQYAVNCAWPLTKQEHDNPVLRARSNECAADALMDWSIASLVSNAIVGKSIVEPNTACGGNGGKIVDEYMRTGSGQVVGEVVEALKQRGVDDSIAFKIGLILDDCSLQDRVDKLRDAMHSSRSDLFEMRKRPSLSEVSRRLRECAAMLDRRGQGGPAGVTGGSDAANGNQGETEPVDFKSLRSNQETIDGYESASNP